MATGGGDSVLDSRYTCSICLEPLKGRHPKILTCFHTFCLHCLTQLTDRETGRSLQTSRDGQVDKDGGSPVRIICPTCRSPTSIPPGGVGYLQKNVYLENDEKEAKNKPPTFYCDLCEEGQTAEYTCGQCLSYFCPRCSRIHDKLCKSKAVTKITASKTAGERKSTEKDVDEEELIGQALKKLSEEEKRLGLEQRAREHDINVRYAALLRHAGEARDVCLASLRDVTQVLSDAFQSDVTLAREKLKKVKQLKAVGGASTSLTNELTETYRRHLENILQKDTEQTLLKFKSESNNEEPITTAMTDFVSTVVPSGQDETVASTTDAEVTGTQHKSPAESSSEAARSPESTEREIKGAESSLDLVAARNLQNEKLISVLETQNSLLCRDLASVHDKNDKLCTDVATLQKEMTSLRDKVLGEMTSLQQGHVSLRDKNSLLCQENTQLRDDVTTVKADHDKLQTDVRKLIADQSKLQSDHVKLQTDVSTVTADHSKLQSSHDKLQTDVSTVTADHSKLQSSHDKLQTDVSTVTADHSKMQSSHDKLQTDVSTVTADHSKLQSSHDKLQTDVNKIPAGQNKLQAEQTQLVAKVETLLKDVGLNRKKNDKFGKELKNTQDTLRQESTARSALETKIGKFGVQVAFTCVMLNTVTTTAQKILICDGEIFSVGGGYDTQTGIFTAPVSGLYCFMATSTPLDNDVSKVALLSIVLENTEIGYLGAYGKGKCTAHSAVPVKAGQKVWLKTFGGKVCTFYGGSTFFTGMLVQAEL